MIKTILFDLDDTIFDFHMAERIALEKTLLHLGIAPKEEILTRYSELNLAQWKLLEQEKITRPQVKVRRYQLLFDEIGVSCSAEEAAAYYENLLGIGHYFMEGAEEILEMFSKEYRLFIVSNGTAKVQRSRIESAGIERYLTGLFISQEIGYNKPSLDFFRRCFAQIDGFCKEETVIVGDSLSSDIKGGNAAGITTIWYNPKGVVNDSDVKPGFEIRHLSELVPLLKSL
ncbi:MAG: YjjG family noncanonical pyrimidine nucleotidase [Oscillospiraceae bacterium]|jgi:2-haloacid dehalogenase